MSKWNRKINKFFKIIKWPMAILMLLILVPAFQADFDIVKSMMKKEMLLEFFLPFGATVIFFLIMPGLSGSFFTIMEHELTHMLFAVLTFHKPKGLDVRQDEGGSFSFLGEGNWLIALAPYFFPTFTFILMIGMTIYQQFNPKLPDLYLVLFGIFLGYHFIVTLFEIHPKQTDFIIAGPIFTICFIPGINLLIYGMFFAWLLKGWSGIPTYYLLLWQKITALIGMG